jgi:hypothetical protein
LDLSNGRIFAIKQDGYIATILAVIEGEVPTRRSEVRDFLANLTAAVIAARVPRRDLDAAQNVVLAAFAREDEEGCLFSLASVLGWTQRETYRVTSNHANSLRHAEINGRGTRKSTTLDAVARFIVAQYWRYKLYEENAGTTLQEAIRTEGGIKAAKSFVLAGKQRRFAEFVARASAIRSKFDADWLSPGMLVEHWCDGKLGCGEPIPALHAVKPVEIWPKRPPDVAKCFVRYNPDSVPTPWAPAPQRRQRPGTRRSRDNLSACCNVIEFIGAGIAAEVLGEPFWISIGDKVADALVALRQAGAHICKRSPSPCGGQYTRAFLGLFSALNEAAQARGHGLSVAPWFITVEKVHAARKDRWRTEIDIDAHNYQVDELWKLKKAYLYAVKQCPQAADAALGEIRRRGVAEDILQDWVRYRIPCEEDGSPVAAIGPEWPM